MTIECPICGATDVREEMEGTAVYCNHCRLLVGLQTETIRRPRSNYVIGVNEQGRRYIECGDCHRRSYNVYDIERRYCEGCHLFLDLTDQGPAGGDPGGGTYVVWTAGENEIPMEYHGPQEGGVYPQQFIEQVEAFERARQDVDLNDVPIPDERSIEQWLEFFEFLTQVVIRISDLISKLWEAWTWLINSLIKFVKKVMRLLSGDPAMIVLLELMKTSTPRQRNMWPSPKYRGDNTFVKEIGEFARTEEEQRARNLFRALFGLTGGQTAIAIQSRLWPQFEWIVTMEGRVRLSLTEYPAIHTVYCTTWRDSSSLSLPSGDLAIACAFLILGDELKFIETTHGLDYTRSCVLDCLVEQLWGDKRLADEDVNRVVNILHNENLL